MLSQPPTYVNPELDDLPPVWAEPACRLQEQITECDDLAAHFEGQIKSINGQLRYWTERREKLSQQLAELLSTYKPAIFAMAEAAIHQHFITNFSDDFEIEREVWGEYESDIAPKKPRIDFLIYPKPHIVALGFPETWVGVEAKAPKDDRQAIEVIQQAENYRMALFSRPDAGIENVRPEMVLIYPPIDYFFARPEDAKLLKMHAHKSRVGSIQFHQATRYRRGRWSIKFADDTAYFYSDTGLVNSGAVLNNIYLGNGRVK